MSLVLYDVLLRQIVRPGTTLVEFLIRNTFYSWIGVNAAIALRLMFVPMRLLLNLYRCNVLVGFKPVYLQHVIDGGAAGGIYGLSGYAVIFLSSTVNRFVRDSYGLAVSLVRATFIPLVRYDLPKIVNELVFFRNVPRSNTSGDRVPLCFRVDASIILTADSVVSPLPDQVTWQLCGYHLKLGAHAGFVFDRCTRKSICVCVRFDGRIMAPAHALDALVDSGEFWVRMLVCFDGVVYPATFDARHPVYDICVGAFDSGVSTRAVTFAVPREGDRVYTLLPDYAVPATSAHLSLVEPSWEPTLLTISTTLDHGYSGSPVIRDGKLVGIYNSVSTYTSCGFFVPFTAPLLHWIFSQPRARIVTPSVTTVTHQGSCWYTDDPDCLLNCDDTSSEDDDYRDDDDDDDDMMEYIDPDSDRSLEPFASDVLQSRMDAIALLIHALRYQHLSDHLLTA